MKKPPTRRRTIWIPDALWAQLEAAAKARYQTVSALLRQFVVSGLRGAR